MKLILCKNCDDIVTLTMKERKCLCELSGGAYKNQNEAYYFGEHCVPLFISNKSLVQAIRNNEDLNNNNSSKINSFTFFAGVFTNNYASFKRKGK